MTWETREKSTFSQVVGTRERREIFPGQNFPTHPGKTGNFPGCSFPRYPGKKTREKNAIYIRLSFFPGPPGHRGTLKTAKAHAVVFRGAPPVANDFFTPPVLLIFERRAHA